MGGWVKLHRSLLDSDLWLSEPFTKGQAWADLFGLANHSDNSIWIRGIEVKIKRGWIAWSEVSLAKRWKWSRGKVRRFLKWLKTEQQIEQQNNNLTTLINIRNYNLYQSNDTPNDTPDGQQTDSKQYTNKKGENVEKKKKIKKKFFSPPTQEDVQNYFFENGYSNESGLKAWKYYDAGNWKDAKGNQVISWKQKMRGVWFKDENKITNGNSRIPKSIKEREREEKELFGNL